MIYVQFRGIKQFFFYRGFMTYFKDHLRGCGVRMNQGQTKLYSLEKTWMLRSWKKDSRHVYYDAKKLNTVL